MAITNHERVGKALETLKVGLGPFVDREIKSAVAVNSISMARVQGFLDDPKLANKSIVEWDAAALLKLMGDTWNDVFRRTLGYSERSLVSEIREWRNKWAHQATISSDDAYRALDSVSRLLTAVSAPQADDVEKMKMELLRVRFDDQTRGEKRKSAGATIETGVMGSLKPWREVVMPHDDVASGRYQQAEFAADLWQVHLGEGTPEYRDPVEFFRRTFLTSSLTDMLVGAVKRLTVGGGDPVVQLQTNFGGGKTHSMLALYHLFSGIAPTELAGIDAVMKAAGTSKVPKARRVVLVGNKISPGNPSTKPDGTVVHTLWGELAWQLGGKKAYARIKADDEKATSPGDVMRELFNEYGPCLILVDEWVAYARQLHDQSDLPAGGFETQFTFAQVLTESAKLAKNCLLVISLPASDTSGSPHTQADDVEVGGTRGREALDRLRNVVGRVESSWRPATAEEGFEIVRRRLFKPLVEPAQFKDRDVVARAFAEFYRTQQAEFPPECRESEYEQRMKMAFPIHPEIFDRLYTDWSTLVKFQRTRGVLRLMAAVIHSLWEKGDRSPLIMPANIAIDDPRVQSELTRYLSDNWVPVIEKDVDGPNSLPLKLDNELPNLGKFSACRRVARAIYMGSAPTTAAAHKGIEDRRVKLGCVMPGESPAIFGDALRRMASAATYLYQDGPHYWYSTQPTVTKLAEDRAEQLKRDPDKVAHELEQRLRKDLARTGDFKRVHAMPQTSADVPDDTDARLVVLGVAHPYSKEGDSPAEIAAKAILESRGNTPRLYRNTLVFLAPDKTRLQDLDEAARKTLAWRSILAEADHLDLTAHQKTQVETQLAAAEGAVTARLPETYQWLLVPVQGTPQATPTWEALRLTGADALAARASKKLRTDELYLTSFAPSRLSMELERIPLWRGDQVAVKQLAEDFARYLYLPRLMDTSVLLESIRDGVNLLTWAQDSFGFADSFDEAAGRYRGLRAGQMVAVSDAYAPGLLVKPDVAAKQLEAERAATPSATAGPASPGNADINTPGAAEGGGAAADTRPKRFHGSVVLDSARVGRDAAKIAEEVIAHLIGLVGSRVTVTLEIHADIPEGTPDNVVRTVTENSSTLKFIDQGLERD
jgi:predicted AAA+ superfamily ATPase